MGSEKNRKQKMASSTNQTAITYADGSQQIFMYDKKDRLSLVISPEGHKKSYV
jgi:YD repeat-containing protein